MDDSDSAPLDQRRRSGDLANDWWRRVRDKFLFPLALLATVAVVSSAIGTWVAVQRLTDRAEQTEARLGAMRAEVEALRGAMVSRAEMLETLKRVEQQMEIITLRSRLPKIEVR